MGRRNRFIIGSALGLAAIAVAIDHTRHRLPEPVKSVAEQDMEDSVAESASPCGFISSPCSLGESPCSLSPCSLGDSPCSLQAESPCSL